MLREPPSSTLWAALPKLTATCATSSSEMLTTVSSVEPSTYPAGRTPRLSLTDSSSLLGSSGAVNFREPSLAPLAMVTVSGRFAERVLVAPPWSVTVRGMSTRAPAAESSFTFTVTEPPSATV